MAEAGLYDSFFFNPNQWIEQSQGGQAVKGPTRRAVRLLSPLALNSLMTYAALLDCTAVHLTIPLSRQTLSAAPLRRHFMTCTVPYPPTPLYPPPRYNPSIATFACQIPSRRTSLNIAGAGTMSANATGTSTISSNESSIVIPGLITRK
jgi:hypothetical protein